MLLPTILTSSVAETAFVKVAAGGSLLLFARRIWMDRFEWFDRFASHWRRALHPEREEIIPEYETSMYGQYAQRFMVDSFGYDWERNSTTIAILKRFNPRAYNYFKGLEISLEDLKNLNVDVKAYDTAVVVAKLQRTTAERDQYYSDINRKNAEIGRLSDANERQLEKIEEQADEITNLRIWKAENEALITKAKVILSTETEPIVIASDTRKKNPCDNMGKKNKQIAITLAGNCLGFTVKDCMKRFNMQKSQTIKSYYREVYQSHEGEKSLKELADLTTRVGEIAEAGQMSKRTVAEWKSLPQVAQVITLFNDSEVERIFDWLFERRQDEKIHILSSLSEEEMAEI